MAKRRSKKLLEADKFRVIVMSLRRRTDVDWRPYEDNWLETQAKRPSDYIYSEKQRRILNQLIAAATLFAGYSEYTVVELIKMTYPHRFELDYPDEEFLEQHFNKGTAQLSVRLIRYLASLYRQREALQRDEAIEAVYRETWTEDTSLTDYDEGDPSHMSH